MNEEKSERIVGEKEIMGSLVAARSVLESALNLLTREQLQFLHEVEAGTLNDLRALWGGRTPEDFRSGILEEYDRLMFRLRHKVHLLDTGQRESRHSDATDRQLFCRKCEMPAVPPLDLANSRCPKCGGDEFLELI